jgi:hypothetical protein
MCAICQKYDIICHPEFLYSDYKTGASVFSGPLLEKFLSSRPSLNEKIIKGNNEFA